MKSSTFACLLICLIANLAVAIFAVSIFPSSFGWIYKVSLRITYTRLRGRLSVSIFVSGFVYVCAV